jgi:hypothetical protein
MRRRVTPRYSSAANVSVIAGLFEKGQGPDSNSPKQSKNRTLFFVF